MLPTEVITFLQHLSVGQLEIIYENLVHKRECVAIPLPPSLVTADYLIINLCTFSYLDLLEELLQHETDDGHSLRSELGSLYSTEHCSTQYEETIRGMLKHHHTYASRMELFAKHAQTIDWMEEPFERLVGMFSQQNIGFRMVLDNTAGNQTVSIQASHTVDSQWLQWFAKSAYQKYPTQFAEEYCQYTYQTKHYEHPIRVLLDSFAPTNHTANMQWDEAITCLCSEDTTQRSKGITHLQTIVQQHSHTALAMAHLTENAIIINNVTSHPHFEAELASKDSILSALWIYAYMPDICPPSPSALNRDTDALTNDEYNALMMPIRKLFAPFLATVHSIQQQSIEMATV